jgi:hypothetical protein
MDAKKSTMRELVVSHVRTLAKKMEHMTMYKTRHGDR